MIRLIAIDLDGTLMPEDQKVPEPTREILIKVAAKGIYVVITSGRCYGAGVELKERLGLRDQPMILHNGDIISIPGEKNEVLKTIPLGTVKKFYIACTENNWKCSFVFGPGSKAYTNTHDKFSNHVMRDYNRTELEYINGFEPIAEYSRMEEEPNKILIVCDDLNRTAETYRTVERDFGKEMNVFESGTRFIDIAPKGITKGTGLMKLMDTLDITKDEVMYIGDGENDIPALDVAGISVAMGNALERVRENAAYITDTNEHEGVRKAVERFVL